jgi:hypothetical protein
VPGAWWKTNDASDVSFDVAHGETMSRVACQPTVAQHRRACPGAHKKLDRLIPGFGQRLSKCCAAGSVNRQTDARSSETPLRDHAGNGRQAGESDPPNRRNLAQDEMNDGLVQTRKRMFNIQRLAPV